MSSAISSENSGSNLISPPPPDAVEPLGPKSLAWRLAGDRTMLLVAPRTLTIQVAHPSVGAAVMEHSRFREDPWGRLDHTLGAFLPTIYGREDAHAAAVRLVGYHNHVKGVDGKGRPYDGRDPEPYLFVHMSNFDAVVTARRFFGKPLSDTKQATLYEEWKQLGQLLGLQLDHMPPTLDDFREYFADKLENRLEHTHAVDEVLHITGLTETEAPPSWFLPKWIWAAIRPIGGDVYTTITVGTMPPVLREKFGLRWSTADNALLQAYATAIRTTSLAVPARMKLHPIAYQAKRISQMAGN